MEIQCTSEVYIKPKKIFATLFSVCIILTSARFYFLFSEELELIRSQNSDFFFSSTLKECIYTETDNLLVWKFYQRVVFLRLKITSCWNEICVTMRDGNQNCFFFFQLQREKPGHLAASTEHQVQPTGNKWASCIKWPRKKKTQHNDWHYLYLFHFCWMPL